MPKEIDSTIFHTYDAERAGNTCSCGKHASQTAHDDAQHQADVQAQVRSQDAEQLSNDVVEESVMRALFPQAEQRRDFLRAVGINTARAAIASMFPLGALQAMAQEKNGATIGRRLRSAWSSEHETTSERVIAKKRILIRLLGHDVAEQERENRRNDAALDHGASFGGDARAARIFYWKARCRCGLLTRCYRTSTQPFFDL